MSLNQYIQVGRLVNSCLVGANTYVVCSTKEEFSTSLVEEVTHKIHQTKGHSYMKVSSPGENRELWMIPFEMEESMFLRFLDNIEYVRQNYWGISSFCFPFDVVREEQHKAYLIRPINRQTTVPVRKFMPDSYAERWKIAQGIFERVLELKKIGLTSNGISREQIRVCLETNEVVLWLNQTFGKIEDSQNAENIILHEGYLSIPQYTQDCCKEQNIPINGTQRDVFSAAVATFYLILYSHPFIGSGFYSLLKNEYFSNYQHFPLYIMMGNDKNRPDNQFFGRLVEAQWESTVPALKKLFDSLFKGITDPQKYWNSKDPCWDPEKWLEAIKQDAEKNDNETSRTDFSFMNEQYHQV